MSTINTTLNSPPRSSGRPPGAKSKTSMKRVADLLSEAGKHPVEEILKLMNELDAKEQATMWLHLLKYCEAPAIPKPDIDDKSTPILEYKRVEPSGN